MADVFVSYSRRDSDFVRRLADSVSERGKEVWLDTEGIADAEVFPEAIKRAIEGSDAFVFVITPSAVESTYCENEVEYARDLSKRIVPVLRDPVPDPQLPPEIRDRNWIPFTDDRDFDTGVARLLNALDTDLEATKAHTRWLVKAIEWDKEGRDKSFLLRGAELRAAEAWLAAAPVEADPAATPLQREYVLASRQAATRRQRALVGASLGVALVSIGLLVFALISRGQAISAQAIATSRALAAQAENQVAVDPERSILLAMQAVRISPTPDALFALRAAIDASPLRMTLLRPAQVGCQLQAGGPNLAYDPAAPLLAEGICSEFGAGAGRTPTGGPPPGRLLVFDTRTGRVLVRAQVGIGGAPALAYAPDGSLLAAANGDGVVRLLDPRTAATRAILGSPPASARPGPGQVLALALSLSFSPDGSLLAEVTQFQAKVWSLRRRSSITLEGQPVPSPTGPNPLSATFTRDGRDVVVAGGNGARVFDARTGALIRVLPGTGQASSAAVSPDGRQLAVANTTNQGGVVSVWSTRAWSRIGPLVSSRSASRADFATFPARGITAVAYTADGNDIVIGAADGSAGLWSVRTRTEIAPYVGSTSSIAAVAPDPRGQQVATASADGTTNVWRASGPQELSLDTGQPVDEVRIAGSRLIAAIGNGVIRSWLLPTAKPQHTLHDRTPGPPRGFFLSPDGALSIEPFYNPATRDAEGVSVRSTTTGELVRTAPSSPALSMVGASPDGRLLVMLGDLSATVSRRRPTGPPRRQGAGDVIALASGARVDLHVVGAGGLAVRGCPWNAATISRDDRLVAATDFCGLVAIWDAQTGRLRTTFTNTGEPSRIAFSPDGRQLAVASWNSTITIWDLGAQRVAHVLAGHSLGVDGLAYSPNGRLLASASLDDTARVWDPASGRILRVWSESQPVSSVTFSSDGTRLVTSDATGTISVWDACTACGNRSALLAIARTRVTRQLTGLERATFGAG